MDEIPGSIHLLLLFLKSAVQLSFILRQLQLEPQNFGLLGLEGKQEGGWEERGINQLLKVI